MAVQPVFNPTKSTPAQATNCQIFQENAMRESIKGSAEDQANNTHSLFLNHQADHLVIKGDQVGEAVPVPPKSMLPGPDSLVVLYVLCNDTKDDLLHDPPWHSVWANRPVVSWTLCLSPILPAASPPSFL